MPSGSILYYSEFSEVPYCTNRFVTCQKLFCYFLQQTGSDKKNVTHNFWTIFGDSDCGGAGSEPCQGSKRFKAGTVHYCSFPSVRNTKLPDEPGKSIALIPKLHNRYPGICGYTRIGPNHVFAGTLRMVLYHCYGQENENNSLQNPRISKI